MEIKNFRLHISKWMSYTGAKLDLMSLLEAGQELTNFAPVVDSLVIYGFSTLKAI